MSSPIEDYLAELSAALRIPARQQRRILAESRDHLGDAAEVRGEEEAVPRFGPAVDLAASLGAEVAVRSARRATAATMLGVAALAASTLAVVHGADPSASAIVPWAVAFFVCAQVCAVACGLAVLRSVALRFTSTPVEAADAALLSRRCLTALAFALATLLAAAGAVPGRAAAWQLLAGPVVALGATVPVLRARRVAHRVSEDRADVERSPLTDAVLLLGRGRRSIDEPSRAMTWSLFGTLTVLAGIAAFGWDHLDQGTMTSSSTAAGVEMGAALTGLLLLGRPLGLARSAHADTSGH